MDITCARLALQLYLVWLFKCITIAFGPKRLGLNAALAGVRQNIVMATA